MDSVRPRVASSVRSSGGSSTSRLSPKRQRVAAAEPNEDGSVVVTIPIESIPNAAATLCRFGDSLEVLEPPELRTELATLGRTLSTLYS